MGKDLDISLSELEGFGRELAEIVELVQLAVEDAEKIGQLSFYKGGQAEEAVKALRNVPRRYESVIEHYSRLYQIVALTWEKMAEADERIARVLVAHDR